MNIISWNVIGLNGPSKQRMLKQKLQKEKLVVIFIQETKSSIESLVGLMTRIWKEIQSIFIDAQGAARGISII